MDAGGGVLSLGTAMFQESWTNQHVNEAVMRTVATPDIKAFWPAGSDGDVVSHGGAEYNGSLPSDDAHASYGVGLFGLAASLQLAAAVVGNAEA